MPLPQKPTTQSNISKPLSTRINPCWKKITGQSEIKSLKTKVRITKTQREQFKSGKPRIWLLGDSILDNSFWNGVGANNTTEILRNLMPDYEVIDKATEDLDSLTMIQCIKKDTPYQVAEPYVDYRKEIGVPYDPPSGKVDLRNLNISPNDFLVLSVGGNDFLHRGELNPPNIIGKHGTVAKILKFY